MNTKYAIPVTDLLLYYADNANIPEDPVERRTFMSAARNLLLDQLIIANRRLCNLLDENERLRNMIDSE